MSRVTLLAVNSKYVHSSLAVWVLAGGVSAYSRLPHDVNVVEATIHQANNDIAGQVAAFSPDVVGISAYIWNAVMLTDLLRLLRDKLPKAVIVLGGPEASHNAEYWLARGADHVLRGEGEHSFPALLDTLASGVPSAPLEPMRSGEPVDPYSKTYFETLGGRIAYLETSRGCPFKCAFCLSAGESVRFFPLNIVKEQIIKLSQSGTQTIKLADRTFNCSADRAYELFEYIIGMNTDCRFHFEVAADLFDERSLSLLSQAPPSRIQFEAGLQSYFAPALNAASRQTDLEKAEKNIRRLLSSRNIHIHLDLIAGLPYETLSDFQRGFDRAFSLGAHTLQLGFLKLLHGSALRAQAEAYGIQYDAEPPYEITGSPWLSSEDIRVLKLAENALQHTYNKSRFLSALEYVMSVPGIAPFSLFRTLGESVPNHGMQLNDYAERIYNRLIKLPNVNGDKLRDCLVCDWLGMVAGKNMPLVLKRPDRRHKQVMKIAEKQLGRRIARNHASILLSGASVFVDDRNRDPVSGLFKLFFDGLII